MSLGMPKQSQEAFSRSSAELVDYLCCHGCQTRFMLWALYPECSFSSLPHGSLPLHLSKTLLRAQLIGGAPLGLLSPIAAPSPPSFLWVLFTLFCFVSPTRHSTYHRLTGWLVLHVLFIVRFLLLLDCQLHERHISNTYTGVWHLGHHFVFQY